MGISGIFWSMLKWVLFRIDAETAHLMTVALVRLGFKMGKLPLRIVAGNPALGRASEAVKPQVLGMSFLSRVGLAAGFDKNAELVAALPELGFGFAEIGTVTPRPQPGNDRPRLFRDPSKQALFNRMGFNNLGATVVASRLAKAREGLPEHFRVGVNIGKNKDTPLDGASKDYADAARAFEGLADYMVINVSSPNTPGLRSLQSIEAIKPIILEVKNVISRWKRVPPLFLKLAPEVKGGELAELLRFGEQNGVQGWVLTNTLAGNFSRQGLNDLLGGWSGSPLTLEARASLVEARKETSLPIISVGGIMSEKEARDRRGLGADLIQVYSGWIYGGPAFVKNIAKMPEIKA